MTPVAATNSEKLDQLKVRRAKRVKNLLFFAVYALLMGTLLAEVFLRWRTRERASRKTLMNVVLLPLDPVPPDRARALGLDPEDAQELPYLIPDPELGWSIRPLGRTRFQVEGHEVEYAANSLGLRSAPCDLVVPKPERTTRVLIVGDSFAHGDELPWPATWIAQLEDRLGDGFETWTGGVPGYGTDQALLRLERLLPTVKPDVVLLVVYRQDLLRNLTFFRSLHHPQTGIPWSKPRFILHGDTLEVLNSPAVPPADVEATLRSYPLSPLSKHDRFWLPELYADDLRYRSRIWQFLISRNRLDRLKEVSIGALQPGGEAVVLGGRLAERFKDAMAAAGIRPLVVILPDNFDIPTYAVGAIPLVQAFRMELDRLKIPWIDVGPELYASVAPGEEPSVLFVRGEGHPNERASRLIAGTIATALRK